jgi:hypothetical protein
VTEAGAACLESRPLHTADFVGDAYLFGDAPDVERPLIEARRDQFRDRGP